MAESFKDKIEDAGDKIAEKATEVGHKIGEKVEEAADWAKEKAHQVGFTASMRPPTRPGASAKLVGEHRQATGSVAEIKPHMDVYASCGAKVGKVDHVQGDDIKLTRHDSPDGQHHLIPQSWVAKVHDHVHLNKDHQGRRGPVAAGPEHRGGQETNRSGRDEYPGPDSSPEYPTTVPTHGDIRDEAGRGRRRRQGWVAARSIYLRSSRRRKSARREFAARWPWPLAEEELQDFMLGCLLAEGFSHLIAITMPPDRECQDRHGEHQAGGG